MDIHPQYRNLKCNIQSFELKLKQVVFQQTLHQRDFDNLLIGLADLLTGDSKRGLEQVQFILKVENHFVTKWCNTKSQ